MNATQTLSVPTTHRSEKRAHRRRQFWRSLLGGLGSLLLLAGLVWLAGAWAKANLTTHYPPLVN